MSLRVKICGITNLEDAMASLEAGADALGFVFCASSPRQISPAAAAEIIEALPPFVNTVGLFANSSEKAIAPVLAQCRLDTLQLHGDEPPGCCRNLGLRVIKAFRIRDEESLAGLAAFARETWLLDSFVPGKLGGTGERFNWDLACRVNQSGRRIILAGGLTPDNVASAVRQVRPYAVDVSSGVESHPGKKDHSKLRSFIRAAKSAIQGS